MDSSHLDLIHVRRKYRSILLQFLNVTDPPITHTDRSRLALLEQSFKCQPHHLSLLSAWSGTMDEKKIDVPVLMGINCLDTLH